MSQLEGRDAHGRRLHSSSRSERADPNRKRTRDDRAPETERTHSSSRITESAKTTDDERKRSKSLQDDVRHENPEAKSRNDAKDVSAAKNERSPRSTRHHSDSREVPRLRTHVQHNDRGSAGQGGRRYDRRASDHGRHRDQKEQAGDRDKHKPEGPGLQEKGEGTRPRSDGDSVWKHDRFSQLDEEVPQAKKRPAFRETKMPLEPEPTAAVTELNTRPHKSDQPGPAFARREERVTYRARGFDKPEGPLRKPDERSGKREFSDQRSDGRRNDYDSRGSFAGRGGRGRDRFNNSYGERNIHQPAGGEVEKWKHDLYDQMNRSPSPKNEEEQIAKVEALLAL